MLSLLRFELKYYFKNLNEAIYIYGLFISIICISPFSQQAGTEALHGLGTTFLWIALISSINIGGLNLYRREMEHGRLEYLQLLPISLESAVMAKWAAFYLFIIIPLGILFPVSALLLNIPVSEWGHIALGLALGAAALSTISNLAAVLMAGLEKGGAVLALIVLPLSIPVMIFGAHDAAQIGAINPTSLMAILGFTIFLLPILAVAGASCIRASN